MGVLGSGGLWATLSEKFAVNVIGRHFADADDAAECVGREALRRWEDPNCKARACLRDDEQDCFSVLVLFPSKAAPNTGRPQSPRKFAVGPHQEDLRETHRSWNEVKSVARVNELRDYGPGNTRCPWLAGSR